MQPARQHLRRGAWLALLSLWWLALAPTLVQFHATSDPLAWVPICTSQGLVQGQTTPEGAALPNPAEHLRADAALTAALHGPVHALAAGTVVLAVPAGAAEAPAISAPESLGPPPVWSGARARAPPAA